MNMNITGKTKKCFACQETATYWLGHVHPQGGSNHIIAGWCMAHSRMWNCSEQVQLLSHVLGTKRAECEGCYGDAELMETLPPVGPWGERLMP